MPATHHRETILAYAGTRLYGRYIELYILNSKTYSKISTTSFTLCPDLSLVLWNPT